MIPSFDVFRVEATSVHWLGTAATPADALKLVQELFAQAPSDYLIVHQQTGSKFVIKRPDAMAPADLQPAEGFAAAFNKWDSGRRTMEDLLKEVLAFAEGTGKWLNEAAQHFENLAAQLAEDEKPKWQLLAAVYRERAHMGGGLIAKTRESLAAEWSDSPQSQESQAN
jgi:hypothetical protein